MMEDEREARLKEVIETRVLPMIEAEGFMVQGVFAVAPGDSSFAYTVGLTARGWCEMILLGNIEQAHIILTEIVHHYDKAGGEPLPGDLPDIFDTGYILRLRACSVRDPDMPFSMARRIYGNEVRGLQVLMPDDKHRYPGEDKACSLTWQKLVAAP